MYIYMQCMNKHAVHFIEIILNALYIQILDNDQTDVIEMKSGHRSLHVRML